MKKFLTLLMLITLSGVFAETPPAATGNQPPPPPPHSGKSSRREAAMAWRAFARLSQEERQKLMLLQRTRPEEFRKKLKELSAKAHAEEQAKRLALRKLVNEYRSCSDNARKELLKAEIEKSMREDYMTRLQEFRRHLEEMKRRTAKMETELNKRAEKADEAIQARLQMVLDGGDPFPPPRRRLNRGK
ncbi:MAG: hypothetical protein IJZ19_03450 [Lentisphaeria bacterium]|nr:hypothetical protein [Lentisphaeria bacterium]